VADGGIYALDRVGSTLYVGGAFTTLGGLARNCLAALPLSDPAVPTSWDPEVDDWVVTLAHSASVEYAGGFRSVGGVASEGLAAVSLSTGARVGTWAPPVEASAVALVQQGAVFGGNFGLFHAPPDAPTAVSAAVVDDSATVSFAPPAYDGGGAVDSYMVTSSGGQPRRGRPARSSCPGSPPARPTASQ
jgi:hypothetical protein